MDVRSSKEGRSKDNSAALILVWEKAIKGLSEGTGLDKGSFLKCHGASISRFNLTVDNLRGRHRSGGYLWPQEEMRQFEWGKKAKMLAFSKNQSCD